MDEGRRSQLVKIVLLPRVRAAKKTLTVDLQGVKAPFCFMRVVIPRTPSGWSPMVRLARNAVVGSVVRALSKLSDTRKMHPRRRFGKRARATFAFLLRNPLLTSKCPRAWETSPSSCVGQHHGPLHVDAVWLTPMLAGESSQANRRHFNFSCNQPPVSVLPT
jgi:hypothetical protein